MSEAKIPLLDVEAQNAPLFEELEAVFRRVLTSGHFILGPDVAALEREVAAMVGVAHAVGVSSGTDALLAALMALDVGPGDEVITTPFTFFATAGCIARLGAKPVFVDIEPDTFNIDPAAVAAAIGPKTKAIVPVHLFGRPADMARLAEVAGAIPIVEDAAQALGARTERGAVGALGAMGCFSFFPSKNLGGFGDGGIVTTGDAALAERLRVLRAHGSKPKYFHALVGGNFRLDTVQAALLRVKLPHLERYGEGRRRNAARYDALFAAAALPPERLRTPRIVPGHVFNQYVIRTDRRDALMEHLKGRQIDTAIYYPLALHRQACFAGLGLGEGSLPVSEQACREVLALPVYPELGEERLTRVVEACVEFLGR